MHCRYCSRFHNAKWRISPGADDEDAKKKKEKLRFCNIAAKYIKGDQDICGHFEPHHLFWCLLYACWLDADVCLKRFYKGDDEFCNRCSQHKTIIDLKKSIILHKRRLAMAETEADKPKLIKREKPNEE